MSKDYIQNSNRMPLLSIETPAEFLRVVLPVVEWDLRLSSK